MQYHNSHMPGYTIDFCLSVGNQFAKVHCEHLEREKRGKKKKVGILFLVNHLICCIANGLFIWIEHAYRVQHILLTKVRVRALIFVYNLSRKAMCMESTVGRSWKWGQNERTGPIKSTDENEEKQTDKHYLKIWVADEANYICWYLLNRTEKEPRATELF